MSGTSSNDPGQSGSVKRARIDDGEDIESENRPVKKLMFSKEHDAAGLKSTLHGSVYQLKLLTLFLKRGLDAYLDVNKKCRFFLATEMISAGKFDDVVFVYEEKGKYVFRFLQAKHKQDENKKITLQDLLTEKDGEFSLKKYFLSYQQIKKNPEFDGYEFKDFIICTNIDIDEGLVNSFKLITDDDNILHFETGSKTFKRLKLDPDQFPEKDELFSILRRTSELRRLAYIFAVHVLHGKRLELRDLFKIYHGVLGEKVIQRIKNTDGVEVGKFRKEFIQDEISELKKFRSAFYGEYAKLIAKEQIDEKGFWEKMKGTELKMSSTFGRKFEVDPNPVITDPDSEMLAEKIAVKMDEAEEIVEIRREGGKYGGVIKNNINKLAGYVFVKKGEENNDEFYFSSEFLNDDKSLPDGLKKFRHELKDQLKDVDFTKMSKCKFRIANFNTCEEGQLHMKYSLPDDYIDDSDIQNFFSSLVLSVNQPNEEELGEIIEYEMGKDFNLIDNDLMACKLQNKMLDWMKDKKGRFLSDEEGKHFFEKISEKISKLVLIGPTLIYLAKVEKFQILYKENLVQLQEFLSSDQNQIFNLICSHDTVFGSVKVFQILKNTNCLQGDDSYIFMRLHSLLYIQDRVLQVFKPGTSTPNILVIECKPKKNMGNVLGLCNKLSLILEKDKNKKIVLITLENSDFAKNFKKRFSKNVHCKEIKDEKNNLTDLMDESQKRIISEETVVFQGKEVCLDAVLDTKSTNLLSGEVLSMILNNEQVEISASPIDTTHHEIEDCYNDVEDYYIDRTLFRNVMIKKDFKKENTIVTVDDSEVDIESIIHQPLDQSHTDIVLVSDTGLNFNELCGKFTQCNIHWLKKHRHRFVWQKSYGSLAGLRKFVVASEESITKYKPNKLMDLSDRIVLLIAESGMGKSSVLHHLTLKTQSIPSPPWIVRSNLADHSTEFFKWKNSAAEIDKKEAVKFVYKSLINFQQLKAPKQKKERENMIDNLLTLEGDGIVLKNDILGEKGLLSFEIKLFTHFLNHGKVVLLFDGFDEICPSYKNEVMRLLEMLKSTQVLKIWLISRPYNIQSELENRWSTFAYALMPFEERDQDAFLMKFWKKNLELGEFIEQKANIFIEEFIFQFYVHVDASLNLDFSSTPLNIFMIADAFSDEFEKFYFSNDPEYPEKFKLEGKVAVLTMYETFVYKKLNIQLRKKLSSFDKDKHKQEVMDDIDEKYKRDIENHEKAAVYSMFEDDQIEKILLKAEVEEVKKFIADIKIAKRKTGIINSISIMNDKPKFIHLSFAEYFTAKCIWEKLKLIQFHFNEDFVQNVIVGILIEDDLVYVSMFLQLMAKEYLIKDCNSLDYKHVQILLQQFVNHFGCVSISWLLGIVESSLSKLDVKDSFKIIQNISMTESYVLLCISARMGYIKLVKSLERNFNTGFLQKILKFSEWKETPLWEAACSEEVDIIQFLIENENFAYDVMWEDKYKKNLIQSALELEKFFVLKSCLKMNLVDCNLTFKNEFGDEELLIHEVLRKNAPSEVVKLLIENMRFDLVNTLIHYSYNEKTEEHMHSRIVLMLLDYDKEIMELAINKGIELSTGNCIDKLLFEFSLQTWCGFIMRLSHALEGVVDKIFYSEKQFVSIFQRIEMLLKAGAGYIQWDSRPIDEITTVSPVGDTSTLQFARRNYYAHTLLNEVYDLHEQSTGENDPQNTILRLMIYATNKCHYFNKFCIRISPCMIDLHHQRYDSIFSIQKNMAALFVNYYDGDDDFVKKILDKLHSYVDNVEYKSELRTRKVEYHGGVLELRRWSDVKSESELSEEKYSNDFLSFLSELGRQACVGADYKDESEIFEGESPNKVTNEEISEECAPETRHWSDIESESELSEEKYYDFPSELGRQACVGADYTDDSELFEGESPNKVTDEEILEECAPETRHWSDVETESELREENDCDDIRSELQLCVGNDADESEIFDGEIPNKVTNEVLEKFGDDSKEFQNKSFDKLVEIFWKGALQQYASQGYDTNDALKEISDEISELEKVIKKLFDKNLLQFSVERKICPCKILLPDADELLDILDLKNVCVNDSMQNLALKIYDQGGEEMFYTIWLTLRRVGRKNQMEILQRMFKFVDQSSRIFSLLKRLNELYLNLVCAVKENKNEEIINILQSESDYVKVLIRGQDDEHGSLLHYAAFNGQAAVVSVLLHQGVDPNFELQTIRNPVSFTQAEQKMAKDSNWSKNFTHWTALHFSVLNDHLEVVVQLVISGANINAVSLPPIETPDSYLLDGYTPLHISALVCGHLRISQLLLEKGARYNVQNNKKKTPLDLATPESDVENLLSCIDGLFQAVVEGDEKSFNSLLGRVDSDSMKAILHAKNCNDKTLSNLANDGGHVHIVHILAEKLRMV